MKVKRAENRIFLEVNPKGMSWEWKPKMYLDYSSVHTPWTKKNVFHGLLIRASTITNTTSAFKRATEMYAKGLVARGCPINFLKYSWKRFLSRTTNHHSLLRKEVQAWFNDMILHSLKKSPLKPQPKQQERIAISERNFCAD